MSSKLNWLIQHTSPGDVILQSWLSKDEEVILKAITLGLGLVKKTKNNQVAK